MSPIGKGGFPPTGERKPTPAVIVPPKGSSTPCPPGWEGFQEDRDFVVYSNTQPPVMLGRAGTLEAATPLQAVTTLIRLQIAALIDG